MFIRYDTQGVALTLTDSRLHLVYSATLKAQRALTHSKYGPVYDVPKNSTKKSYGRVGMKYWGNIRNDSFISQCGSRTKNKQPLSMEVNEQVKLES